MTGRFFNLRRAMWAVKGMDLYLLQCKSSFTFFRVKHSSNMWDVQVHLDNVLRVMGRLIVSCQLSTFCID